MPNTPERRAGVQTRNEDKLTRRRALGCRIWDHQTGLCGNEAVDPDAPIRLCTRHAGLALQWLRQHLEQANPTPALLQTVRGRTLMFGHYSPHRGTL